MTTVVQTKLFHFQISPWGDPSVGPDVSSIVISSVTVVVKRALVWSVLMRVNAGTIIHG